MTKTILKFISYFIIIYGLCISLNADNHSLIQEVDLLYETRDKKNHLEQSLKLIDNHLDKGIDISLKYELCWRYARQVSAIKNYITLSKKEKLTLYTKGLERSKIANQIKKDTINGLYWYAIVLGRQAELKGIRKSLSSVKPIKNTMENILLIDPNFARAYFVLARLYRKAPKVISIGNPKKALTFINKALDIDPSDSIYLLEKARILKKLKRKKAAKNVLKKLINLPENKIYFQDQVNRDKNNAKVLLEKLN